MTRTGTVIVLIVLAGFLPHCDENDRGDTDADVEAPDADSQVDADDAGRMDADDNETGSDADDDADHDLPDVAVRLAEIPGMTVTELAALPGYRQFELIFEQPVDHENPGAGTFEQHITLLHRGEDRPFILAATGYHNFAGNYPTELTLLLDANQVWVEHRYYGASMPATPVWELLNIEQAAHDYHRIVEALRPIYVGAWISTGGSKGGMTALFHRRFHPDDVDGTVAYVSPITLGAPDARYVSFVDGTGPSACQEALRAAQLEALGRRTAMLEFVAELRGAGASFDLIGGDESAFEAIVISIPFTFWQYTGDPGCASIPTAASTDAYLFAFMDEIVDFEWVTDEGLVLFESYYYQAQTELGYPDLRTDHLADQLVTETSTIERGILPAGVTAEYDPEVMRDVAEWIAAEGERLMFIYGEYDPWTAGAVDLGGAVDSYLFIAPRMTHYSEIRDLEAADRELALEVIQDWTGVTPALHRLPPDSALSRCTMREGLRRSLASRRDASARM